MKNIPNFDEFADKRAHELGFLNWNFCIVNQELDALKIISLEFTKLHVEAALKAASEKATINDERDGDSGEGDFYIRKESILKAYPLTNIK